jgi:hypothetical protein
MEVPFPTRMRRGGRCRSLKGNDEEEEDSIFARGHGGVLHFSLLTLRVR